MLISLFIGCYNDTLFPDTGKAVVAVLERLGHALARSGECARRIVGAGGVLVLDRDPAWPCTERDLDRLVTLLAVAVHDRVGEKLLDDELQSKEVALRKTL